MLRRGPLCIVKHHLQVWAQRSIVTTSTPRIPHSDLITINRKRRKTILQSNTSFHSRYIIN